MNEVFDEVLLEHKAQETTPVDQWTVVNSKRKTTNRVGLNINGEIEKGNDYQNRVALVNPTPKCCAGLGTKNGPHNHIHDCGTRSAILGDLD